MELKKHFIMPQISCQSKLKLLAEENYSEKSELKDLKMSDLDDMIKENQIKLQNLRFQKSPAAVRGPFGD